MKQKLTRSENKIIAGVCGGIANYLGWKAYKVQILYLLVSILFTAFLPGIIVYLILWFVMPEEGQALN